MATSTQDLIDAITSITATATPDAELAGCAIAALGHLGRALERLAVSDVDRETVFAARRRLVVGELAASCRAAAGQWPPTPGSLPDLAGAAADLLGRHPFGRDPDTRWAVANELSPLASRCAQLAERFPPYTGIPALRRVSRSADLLRQVARHDPPGAQQLSVLDQAVPTVHPAPARSAGQRAVDAAATLVTGLDRVLRSGVVDMYGALAVCAAAEAVATQGATMARRMSRTKVSSPWHRAPESWRVLQAALIRFDDGSRRRSIAHTQLTAHAVHLHDCVVALGNEQVPDGVTATRYLANQLPTIAQQIGAAISWWADSGRLITKARSLPHTEERVRELIRDDAVMVTARDVEPVLLTARVTQRLSASLAVELDRTGAAVGRQPQPHLIAALTADLHPARTTHDTGWAHRIAARAHALAIDARPTANASRPVA